MKKYSKLTYKDRCKIKEGIDQGRGVKAIGRSIERNHTVISREIKANGGIFCYSAEIADRRVIKRRKYGLKIEESAELQKYIREKLKLGWSPKVIAGRLKIESESRAKKALPAVEASAATLTVSHETIYKWIHSEATKKDKLYLFLQRRKKTRGLRRSQPIVEDLKPSIHQRPQAINDRQNLGDYEADLVFQKGSRSESILTLLDRKSRFAHFIKVPSKHSTVVFDALKQVQRNHFITINSATFDRGTEFANYKDLNVQSFFCDPGSPWQKGSIENLNGILRRLLDYRIPINTVTQERLDSIAHALNNIPREILGFLTPIEFTNNITGRI